MLPKQLLAVKHVWLTVLHMPNLCKPIVVSWVCAGAVRPTVPIAASVSTPKLCTGSSPVSLAFTMNALSESQCLYHENTTGDSEAAA